MPEWRTVQQGPQRTSAGLRRQALSEMGETEASNPPNPLNFSQQQLQNPQLTAPTLHPLLHPCTPTSHYSSPVLLSSENCPKARGSLGWLTPKQSACSSQAGNNLSLLKNTRLLKRSTRLPPPSPPPLTLFASEASGLFPCCCCSTRLHVPCTLALHPSPASLDQTASQSFPSCHALHPLFPQLPFRNAAVAT